MRFNSKDFRQAVKRKRVEWKRHALERMVQRNISREQIFEVLVEGEIIEEYESDKPFPSVLILGFVDNRPLHVVAAMNLGTVFVITTYAPTSDIFGPHFRERR